MIARLRAKTSHW